MIHRLAIVMSSELHRKMRSGSPVPEGDDLVEEGRVSDEEKDGRSDSSSSSRPAGSLGEKKHVEFGASDGGGSSLQQQQQKKQKSGSGNTLRRRSQQWQKDHNFPKHLVRRSISTYAIAFYFCWVWLGIVFYIFKNNWDLGTAYYYAVEAGLSVGYCEPAEPDDASKLFTIFYILSGSTLVSGSLGALASRMIAAKAVLSPTKRSHDEATFRDEETGNYTLRSVWFKLWFETKLRVGWWEHRDRVKILVSFFVWLGVGTTYGMVVERWTFITSLYWAVSACSTGGLQSAPCEPGTGGSECSMGYMRGGMMGTYMLLGVPIYACTMAQFAGITIQKAVVQDRINMLAKPISESEFKYCSGVLSPAGSVTLNVGEFMLMEAMRLKARSQTKPTRTPLSPRTNPQNANPAPPQHNPPRSLRFARPAGCDGGRH